MEDMVPQLLFTLTFTNQLQIQAVQAVQILMTMTIVASLLLTGGKQQNLMSDLY